MDNGQLAVAVPNSKYVWACGSAADLNLKDSHTSAAVSSWRMDMFNNALPCIINVPYMAAANFQIDLEIKVQRLTIRPVALIEGCSGDHELPFTNYL